jgi:hypothetical protein
LAVDNVNVCVDFGLRYDRWSRPLLTVLGTGPKRTIIRVAGGTLHVKFGWMLRIDVPLEDIKFAHLEPKRCWAVGLHQSGDHWLCSCPGVGYLAHREAGCRRNVMIGMPT